MGKMFCPKCKSTNVGKELNVLLVMGVPQQWKCYDCGFMSFIFPELNEETEKTNKK